MTATQHARALQARQGRPDNFPVSRRACPTDPLPSICIPRSRASTYPWPWAWRPGSRPGSLLIKEATFISQDAGDMHTCQVSPEE